MVPVTSFAFDESGRSKMKPTDWLQCYSLHSSTSQRLVVRFGRGAGT